jgi:hypothetical protein
MLVTVAHTLKDYYPLPGTRIKQYVLDTYRENEWERDTCPKVEMIEHDDNTGMPCRYSATSAQWRYVLDHDCCEVCNAVGVALANEPRIKAWLDEKAKRPPICADRELLSDRIAPEWASVTAENPLLKMMKKVRP